MEIIEASETFLGQVIEFKDGISRPPWKNCCGPTSGPAVGASPLVPMQSLIYHLQVYLTETTNSDITASIPSQAVCNVHVHRWGSV
jgi:hypothetical protein